MEHQQAQVPEERRQVRVSFPVRVAFAGEKFLIKEFTENLSEGGIFLATEHIIPAGTTGTLTFRISPWEDPFTVEAEVVWSEFPDQPDGRQPGLGIRFINLDDENRERLERLVNGVQNGSVVAAIRRKIRDEHKSLVEELRRRPTDQKVMLAAVGNREEISAVLQDGNQTAVLRLLDNPQLTTGHVRDMVKDRRTSSRVLSALNRIRRFMADEEVRFRFATHPNAVLGDAVAQIRALPPGRLRQIQQNTQVRVQVRATAQDILKKRERGFLRRR